MAGKKFDFVGKLENGVWYFPEVKSVSSSGKQTSWQIKVRAMRNDKFVNIDEYLLNNKATNIIGWCKVESYMQGGVIKKSEPTLIKEGKNIGKSNETNAVIQTMIKANSLYEKQFKKTQNNESDLPFPMLAKIYDDVRPNPPFTVQRKFNGLRSLVCIKDKCLFMYSRKKEQQLGLSHIKNELESALKLYWDKGIYLFLDGELYEHGLPLNIISGIVRKETEIDSDVKIHYILYDCFIQNKPDMLYEERKIILREFYEQFSFKWVILTESFVIDGPNYQDNLLNLYKGFLSEGYEGAMIRTNDIYRQSMNDYHSKFLLKLKPTRDAEYEIIGWETGKHGKAAQALMIVCKNKEGREFRVTPSLEIEERNRLVQLMTEDYFKKNYLGKSITVYYAELSEYGVPQQARSKLECRYD